MFSDTMGSLSRLLAFVSCFYVTLSGKFDIIATSNAAMGTIGKFSVEETTTFGQLKQMIHASKGYTIEQQTLTVVSADKTSTTRVRDDSQTMKACSSPVSL